MWRLYNLLNHFIYKGITCATGTSEYYNLIFQVNKNVLFIVNWNFFYYTCIETFITYRTLLLLRTPKKFLAETHIIQDIGLLTYFIRKLDGNSTILKFCFLLYKTTVFTEKKIILRVVSLLSVQGCEKKRKQTMMKYKGRGCFMIETPTVQKL